MASSSWSASLWSVAGAAFFALAGACAKTVSGEFSATDLIFYRSLFGAALALLFLRAAGLPAKSPVPGLNLLRSALGILSMALWFFALPRMDFGACMVLSYTTAIFLVSLLGARALVRRGGMPWRMTAVILAGFAGIVLVLRPSFSAGEAFPAAACIGKSLVDLGVYGAYRKLGEAHEPSVRVVLWYSALGAAAGAMASVAAAGSVTLPGTANALPLVAMGCLFCFSQVSITQSFTRGNLLLSSCLGFSAIPISAAVGVALFGDPVSEESLLGMALILASGVAGTVVARSDELRNASRPAEWSHQKER